MVQASSSVRLLLLAVVAAVVLCASVVRADDHPLKCDPGLAGNYMVTRLCKSRRMQPRKSGKRACVRC